MLTIHHVQRHRPYCGPQQRHVAHKHTSTIPTPTHTDRRLRHPRTRQTGPVQEEDAKPPASISTPLHRHQRLILELSDRQDNREAQQALEFGVTRTGNVTSGSQASRTREPWSPYVHHADPQNSAASRTLQHSPLSARPHHSQESPLFDVGLAGSCASVAAMAVMSAVSTHRAWPRG